MKKTSPPKKITDFLEWICPEYLFEGIVGDLEEQFYNDLEMVGEKKAKRRYWWGALRFMRPEIILRNKFKLKIINNMMFSNYLKIAGRNMAKRKLFSFINAFGLSIGIAFCILIVLFIKDERSFDQFHVNKDRIYRMEDKSFNLWEPDSEEKYRHSAYLQAGLGPAMKSDFAQVEYMTRFNSGATGIVKYGDKVFTEQLTFIDLDFFKMFSFELLRGNPDEVLNDKYNVVITPAIAEKYFGEEDPIGKVLILDYYGENEFKVTGIIEAPPANSSLQFDILLAQQMRPYYDRNMEQWSNFGTPTFVQLYPDADLQSLDENLEKLVETHMSENLKRWVDRYDAPEDEILFQFQYKSLNDIHLDTQVSWSGSSDPQYSLILGGIALLILIIACINYVSLALTTSAARKTEVGVRKAIGAQRNQLIGQFTIESIMLAFISMLIGLGLMVLFLPAFNEFTNKEIQLNGMLILQLVALSLGLSLFIGLIAGSYPAFFLSGFKPSQVLKGGFTTKLKAGFTKPLVVLQFAMSAFLIISSAIMYQQMEYVTTKDLGYDQNQIIVVPTQAGWSSESNKVVERMRTRLQMEPEFESVAGTSTSFNQGWSKNGFNIDGEHKSAYVYTVDPGYVETLNIKLKEGRNFNPEILSDSSALIVNEALVADMGWENPLEEHLNWQDDSTSLGFKIIGVAENYHFRSLEAEIEPMFLTMKNGYLTNMLIKTKPGQVTASLDKLKSIWNELMPDKPFDYTFMDEDVAKQYASHQRWMKIMGLATLFAILISCLGLFGLAGINAVNRTKEIGIRKVFGAGLQNIFILLNKQYIYLALIAFVLATPLSWYIMQKWLADFQYSIDLSWPIFAISIVAGLVIALGTVTYHAFKAAQINPASTLKYE